MSSRRILAAGLALGLLAVAGPLPIAADGASAAVGSFLFGRPRTRSRGDGVFEVTARGNNARERRSSLQMALIKAARRAEREHGALFAVLRERSGTWRMNGRAIGDETTLRFKVLNAEEALQDDQGRPARIYRVAEILAGAG
jgi:hypothetical protein